MFTCAIDIVSDESLNALNSFLRNGELHGMYFVKADGHKAYMEIGHLDLAEGAIKKLEGGKLEFTIFKSEKGKERTDYSVNYLSKVSRIDKYHRSEIILHRGNGFYLAEFYEQEQLDEFARMMGFIYTLRKYQRGGRYIHYWEYDLSHKFVDGLGGGFWHLSDLPEGAKPFLGLSNGSIVTCYFVNDGKTITIYRPNPNSEEVYHPMPLTEHIEHQKRFRVI